LIEDLCKYNNLKPLSVQSIMSLSTFEILKIYRDSVVKFLSNLVELFPDQEDLIIMRILFENQIPIEESMKKLSTRLLTPISSKNGTVVPADMIRRRNDAFFLSNIEIFQGMKDQDKIMCWKQLWQSRRLDAADRGAIWAHLELLLGLAEMYNNNQKQEI
jgi:hypothetical protein